MRQRIEERDKRKDEELPIAQRDRSGLHRRRRRRRLGRRRRRREGEEPAAKRRRRALLVRGKLKRLGYDWLKV